eukprot:symbB.v1.2.011587.t3/scaffold771.1/size163808/7
MPLAAALGLDKLPDGAPLTLEHYGIQKGSVLNVVRKVSLDQTRSAACAESLSRGSLREPGHSPVVGPPVTQLPAAAPCAPCAPCTPCGVGPSPAQLEALNDLELLVLLRPLLRKRPTLRAALLAEAGEPVAAYNPPALGHDGIWQRGERCLVWSNSAQRWCDGEVMQVARELVDGKIPEGSVEVERQGMALIDPSRYARELAAEEEKVFPQRTTKICKRLGELLEHLQNAGRAMGFGLLHSLADQVGLWPHSSTGRSRLADSFEAAPANAAVVPAGKGGPKPKGLKNPHQEQPGKEAEELEETLLGKDELEGHPDLGGAGIEDFLKMKQPIFKEYRLLVDTDMRPGSGTKGDIFIQLQGNRGKTGLIHLKDRFADSERTEFSIFAKDVGQVDTIRLANDSPSLWTVDRVYLEGPEGWREFPFGQQLGWPNNPEATVLPSLVSPEVAEESMGFLGVISTASTWILHQVREQSISQTKIHEFQKARFQSFI